MEKKFEINDASVQRLYEMKEEEEGDEGSTFQVFDSPHLKNLSKM